MVSNPYKGVITLLLPAHFCRMSSTTTLPGNQQPKSHVKAWTNGIPYSIRSFPGTPAYFKARFNLSNEKKTIGFFFSGDEISYPIIQNQYIYPIGSMYGIFT